MTHTKSATAIRSRTFLLGGGLPQIRENWPLVLVIVGFIALWTYSRGTPYMLAARVALAFDGETVPARIIANSYRAHDGRHSRPAHHVITYWFMGKDGVARTHRQKILARTLSTNPIPMPPMVTYSPRMPVFSTIHPQAMSDLQW